MVYAVLYGATGIVGSGIVKYLLEHSDIVVIAPVRGNPEKLFQLIHHQASSRLLVPEVINNAIINFDFQLDL
jgi:uncharacterized protein YbjT (DUF2867 family)